MESAGDLPVISTAARLLAPPARDSDFQAAWYYSVVIFAGILVVIWGLRATLRPLGRMWRRGDQGLALAIGAAATVAFLMFASMLVTVAIAMLPQAFSGGSG